MKRSAHPGRTVLPLAATLLLLAGLPLAALNLPLKPAAADPASREALLKECKDNVQTWSLGFAALSVEGVPAGSLSLGEALPRLWRQAYSVDLQHRFDDATRLSIATDIRNGLLNKAREDLSQAIQDRDASWLQERDTDKSESQAQTVIAAARKRVEGLRALDPVLVPIAASKKVVIASPGGADAAAVLFPAVKAGEKPPAALGKTLQGLVYGSLEEAQGYLVLRLAVWDWLLDRKVWEDDWVIDPKTAQSRATEQLESMSTAVLGQASAGLEISVSPKEALVTVLGKATAAPKAAPGGGGGTTEGQTVLGQEPGGGSYHFLPPGDYTVELALDGYQTRSERVTLEGGATRKLELEMRKRDVRFFSLASEPTGARIYFDNRYFGVTPAEVPVPEARTTLSLELEGYRSTRLVVPADPPAEQAVTLQRDLINWKDETRLRRNRMYDALAGLALSILPPLFFNGLYNNIHATIGDGNTPIPGMTSTVQNQLVKEGNLFYYLTYLSAVATVALAVNFAIDLDAYLTAADLASGR